MASKNTKAETTETTAKPQFFHVVPVNSYEVREGRKNEGLTLEVKGLLWRVELRTTETLNKGSVFVTDDFRTAREEAIARMREARLVIADAIESVRQTRMHNLLEGTVPGTTKLGHLTKTDESVKAQKARAAQLEKERAAAEKAAAKKAS